MRSSNKTISSNKLIWPCNEDLQITDKNLLSKLNKSSWNCVSSQRAKEVVAMQIKSQ